ESLAVSRMGVYGWTEPVLATLAGIFSVAYSIRFIHVFFRGTGTGMPKQPHEPPRFMRIPVEALVLICVLVGVLPGLMVEPLLRVAAAPVLNGNLPYYHLTIWHGFNLPLLMSFIALFAGLLLFLGRHRLYSLHARIVPALTAEGAYNRMMAAFETVAERATALLENGSLQRYIALLMLVAVAAVFAPLVDHPFTRGPGMLAAIDVTTAAAWVMLMIAALATAVMHRQRLAALIAISVVGLFVSLAFVRLAAPDLALTQLLVEIVTILLVLLALDYLPRETQRESGTGRHVRDLVIAGAAGIGVAGLAWAVMTRPLASISEYFVRESYPGGGGTNIVNVILVDFRGFDTLGEITVLGVAALGVLVLLRGVDLDGARAHGRVGRDAAPVIPAMITRALLPLALLLSIYLLLRGHNLPGGGFIAGLMAAVALIIQYLASGSAWTESRLRVDYRFLIGGGLLMAAATGLGALAFGYPFLSATFTYLDWPVVGRFEVATAMFFDLGVFLTVIGTVMMMLSRLGTPVADTHAGDFAKEASPWKP
ncbi:MAG TPA: hydrogen gas-evolving membrane-bound hydrogenase subunit E, partial [Longimicrobiales bacterium]|nr:hydrogen gas-evolving membrane-bound hydrogenase subunit E [Longimicrobiales bacterium]